MWSYSNHVLFAPGRETQWLKWCPSDVRFHPVIGFNITSDGTNQNGANQWDAVRMLCHHGAHDRDTQPAWLQRNTGQSEIEQLSKNNWSIFFKSNLIKNWAGLRFLMLWPPSGHFRFWTSSRNALCLGCELVCQRLFFNVFSILLLWVLPDESHLKSVYLLPLNYKLP